MKRYAEITIFFFGEDKGKFVCIPKLGSFPILETDKKFFEKGKLIKFKGDKYLVPSPVKEYLEYTYGDWNTPKQGAHAKQFSNIYGFDYLKKHYEVE